MNLRAWSIISVVCSSGIRVQETGTTRARFVVVTNQETPKHARIVMSLHTLSASKRRTGICRFKKIRMVNGRAGIVFVTLTRADM